MIISHLMYEFERFLVGIGQVPEDAHSGEQPFQKDVDIDGVDGRAGEQLKMASARFVEGAVDPTLHR